MPKIKTFLLTDGLKFAIDAEGNTPPNYLPEAELTKHLLEAEYVPIYGLAIPAGAVIFRTSITPKGPVLCALCEDGEETERRFFLLAPEEKELPAFVGDCLYIDTLNVIFFQSDGQRSILQEHLFEVPEHAAKSFATF